MCLAVPLEISRIVSEDKALVNLGDTTLEINISFLEDPKPGDYVIVHAGFAIQTLDLEEAQERLSLFREMEESM
ncbi:MAG TPA: HypC/HybG/HupF family hydrogenase formation chaperone [Spirochaetia bacterium]|nr:HypC/HybG/HupF family hydrogenase formation chaperone [Spirochaetia bacterium]